jgi:hypothetical protein
MTWRLKKFRNKIAHCAFSWGDSISDFEVWEVEEDENKFQFYKPIKTTVEDTFGYILKTIKDIIPPLTNLLNETETRLKISNPQIYSVLKSEHNLPQSEQ